MPETTCFFSFLIYHIGKGCLLSLHFNQSKQIGTKTVQIADKTVFEAVV